MRSKTVTRTIRPLVKPQSLHVSVLESVKAYIDESGLPPGSQLPPENDLAQQLGVSRNSVREAVKALESVGIVETRRGIGIFVSDFSFAPLLDNLAFGLRGRLDDFEELLTIRRALEGALIGRTVQVIGADDIAELRALTAKMKARVDAGESFLEEDRLFHRTLFRCQDNQLLLKLLDIFWQAFVKASDFINLENRDPVATWRDHHEIVEAVATRDAETARERLDHHYHGISKIIAANKAAS
ncbi:FadR/GntR family transcriptional regulator [Bosea sp. 2RAB26]|uniref:FadR/GntR family transcriptional regulator n=1 Tax=Bosea sp. 2RAB26 TaxID=3237476 RepID=UPI003F93035F